MNFDALATDFDGTIAHDGKVDEPTAAALRRAKGAGIRLVMVTGRELADLFRTFEHVALFDRIVAENGAVLYEPASESIAVIGQPPPAALVDALTSRGVPISIGHCIVATVEPFEHEVLNAIRDLSLEWHLVFNKGSVMALPADITKATGLAPALAALGVTPSRTIGIGDAENDQAFLQLCGLSVAVANALPSVKELADLVTAGARGAGVIELIDALLTERLPRPTDDPPSRRGR